MAVGPAEDTAAVAVGDIAEELRRRKQQILFRPSLELSGGVAPGAKPEKPCCFGSPSLALANDENASEGDRVVQRSDS